MEARNAASKNVLNRANKWDETTKERIYKYLILICYGPKRSLFSFSTAETEKNVVSRSIFDFMRDLFELCPVLIAASRGKAKSLPQFSA